MTMSEWPTNAGLNLHNEHAVSSDTNEAQSSIGAIKPAINMNTMTAKGSIMAYANEDPTTISLHITDILPAQRL